MNKRVANKIVDLGILGGYRPHQISKAERVSGRASEWIDFSPDKYCVTEKTMEKFNAL